MPRLPLAIVLAALLAPATAFAQEDEQPRTAPRTDSPIVTKGPCFDVAANSMPDGDGHDHLDLTAHDFSCGFRQESFLPLENELTGRPDVYIGESDVKADIAVVAVAYPEAGMLTFDVKDPAHPKYLSWYRGGECDFVSDVDCGAYVSLSDDGKMAFLSIQALSPLGNPNAPGSVPATTPGVQVISLDDPTAPMLVDNLPVAGVAGVHTANYHEIPGDPAADRLPGQYLFMTQNSVGIQVARVTRSGGIGKLTPINIIQIDEVHDMFLQEDPIDGRTYMYVAAGFTSGFYVYDVTNPMQPVLKAEWDADPGGLSFYSHTMYVTVKDGRRYVTMPTEGFTGSGHGEVPGYMWIVDATDFSKLGPADATDGTGAENAELAANSQKALVATWHNAANAAAGNLKFSPHNQQIVGDTIFLSQYHGGIVALNAKAAFEGRNERPYEEGVIIPHTGKRPIYSKPEDLPGSVFMSGFFAGHPDIWDMNYYKGYVLGFDMHGGVYSFKPDPSAGTNLGGPGTAPPAACPDVTAPVAKLKKVRLTRKGAQITGTASDKGCRGRAGTLSRVSVAVFRKRGKKCSSLLANGKFRTARSCKAPGFVLAKGTRRFALNVKGRLPRGSYTVVVQAADGAGNLSRGPRRSARVR